MAARTQQLVRESMSGLWVELSALDQALAEVAHQEFGGEDPLKPAIREDLDATVATLRELHETFEALAGPLPLPEVERAKVEESLDFIRHCAEIEAG